MNDLSSPGIPHELIIIGLSMLPILELRGAIPWAIKFAPEMGTAKILLLSVIGNFVPVVPLLLVLEPLSNFLRRERHLDRMLTWLFERTRRRGRIIEKYKALGLAIFVGIPLPGTGAWTGALGAFLFGIRFKWALLAITIGIFMAGVIVTLAAKGVVTFFEWAIG